MNDKPTYEITTKEGETFSVYRDFVRLSIPEGVVLDFSRKHIIEIVDTYLEEFQETVLPGSMRLQIPNRNPWFVFCNNDIYGDLCSAIRKIEPNDCPHLQVTDYGCGYAVAAIVTGRTPAELTPKTNRRLGTERLCELMGGAKRHRCTKRTWEEVASKPNVCAVLIRPIGAKTGHYVAFDGKTITDPELVPTYTPADYPRRDWPPLYYFTR